MKKLSAVAVVVAVLALVATTHPSAEAGGFQIVIGGGHGFHGGHGIHTVHGGHGIHGFHGGSVWHDTSHLDWHPGGWQRHGNHFDYVPGHYDVHHTGHWDHFGW